MALSGAHPRSAEVRPAAGGRPATRRRILIAVVLAAVVAIVAGGIGVGWYYSNELREGAFDVSDAPSPPDLMVAAVAGDAITLQTTEASDLEYGYWRMPGEWGLAWDGGYARVGAIVDLRADSVVRRFTPMIGAIAPGVQARIDGPAFEGDPLSARGLPFEPVTYDSELGPLGAWRIPGSSSTWAILVHGKGQTGKEMLRFLPPFARAGVPMLVIQYRNDTGDPPSASGYYEYGESEWRDLEAAVRYATEQGAENVVLNGVSMGGAIVVSFLYKSSLADRVRAAILDAPAVDFGDAVDYGAERRNLPYPVTWLGKTVAGLRFGFSWRDRDYLAGADRLHVPILLFHGDTDRMVNIRTSDRLASERPDIVTYMRVPGAAHVGSWNADPDAYDRAVSAFLKRVLAP